MSQATSKDLRDYQAQLHDRLKSLEPVFARAAVGDFSADVTMPKEDDELAGFFVGVQIMLDTIREKVTELENTLEQISSASDVIASEKARDEAILDSLGEGLIIVDETAHVTYVNEAAIELFGERARVLGQDSTLIVALDDLNGHPVTPQLHPIPAAIKRNQRRSFNLAKGTAYFVRMANGQRRRLGMTITPIKSSDRVIGAAVVVRDITEESNMDRTKSEIVSIASHQLRTPLTAIRWYVKALMDDKNKPSEEQAEKYLRQVYDSNRHMVQLVDALLNVSRIDLNTLNLKPEAVHLEAVLKDVLKELEVEVNTRKLKITTHLNRNLQPVLIDPNAAHIILQNLVTNAVKYSPNNGEVVVSLQQQVENVVVEVRDQGVGIPSAEQGKIFTKLFRASNAQRMAADGSGLGLYITKAMLERAGGKISFESREKHGTTFYAIIPSKAAIKQAKQEG